VGDLFAGPDGSTFAIATGAAWAKGDIAPISWPNNAATATRFLKWDRDGRRQFSVGVHTQDKDGPPGGFASLRSILGLVRGNVVLRDACAPANVWTADGLFAGTFWTCAKGSKQDALAAAKEVRPFQFDDAQDGQVIETPKGQVLWAANDVQNTMIYRISGWDGWERQSGKITLEAAPPAAQFQGTGLAADYYASADLTGEPALRRVDPAIWFGPLWGSFREVAAANQWFGKDEAAALDAGKCSARWTGFVEAPVSEDFVFYLFTYGRDRVGAKVRLWVDGKLAADGWDGVTPGKVDVYVRSRRINTRPIKLMAGRRMPIKIEYSAAGQKDAHLHLYWESRSNEMRHVPKTLLYPR
jgi:hypothetical protein